MSMEPSPSHTRNSSICAYLTSPASSILSYPSSPASSGYFDVTRNTIRERARQAFVICYSEAGELPQTFWLEPRQGLVSFINSVELLESTSFIEKPYEIYDSMLGDFVGIPPLSEWRYPSRKYSFFLLKAEDVQEADCLEITDWIKILDDDITEFLDFSPILDDHDDTLLPPSSPPSPSPPLLAPLPQYVEKSIQTQETRKRKWFDMKGQQTGPSEGSAVNLNLNVILHEEKDDKRIVKRVRSGSKAATIFHGTGALDDPFILYD